MVDIEQFTFPTQGSALAEHNLATLENLDNPNRIDIPKGLSTNGACSNINERITSRNFIATERLELVCIEFGFNIA